MTDSHLLEAAARAACEAGAEVMAVYAGQIAVRDKADASPVTDADLRAEAVILRHLARMTPEMPVVSEEQSCTTPPAAGRFWLVDPLDGTKEFIRRNGEFTVNIALVEDGRPRLGVVYAPALNRLYLGAPGLGAHLRDASGTRRLRCRAPSAAGLTVVASRSHGDAQALQDLLRGHDVAGTISAGSSLKFCLLAAGDADVYPRLGRTMEWDTAAGDAVLRAAGGRVDTLEGQALKYGKPGLDNPHFVASASTEPWAGPRVVS